MPREILVLRLSSLGDVVLVSSFLLDLRGLFPDARVTFVVREDLAALAGALPGVSRVVAVPRRLGLSGLLALGAHLAHTPWLHVFDLHRSVRSRLLTWRLRGRLRPGFDKQEWPRFVLLRFRRDLYAQFGGARSMRARLAEPLRRMGLVPGGAGTQLILPAAAQAAASAALAALPRAHGQLIAVAPGARWPSKCWPEARFAALVAQLTAGGDHHVLVVGGPDERELAARIAAAAPGRATALAGTLDLLGTAAVLQACAVVLTHDSGLLHIAEAVGRPVVALFGPTVPQFGYAPYRPQSRLLQSRPPCSPCSKNGSRPCRRPTHECMDNLTVGAVRAAVDAVLQTTPDPAGA